MHVTVSEKNGLNCTLGTLGTFMELIGTLSGPLRNLPTVYLKAVQSAVDICGVLRLHRSRADHQPVLPELGGEPCLHHHRDTVHLPARLP